MGTFSGTPADEEAAAQRRGAGARQGESAEGSKEKAVRVMVVMPDDNICCGLQLSPPPDDASGGKSGSQAGADACGAAKLVDAASVQERGSRTHSA